MICCESVVPTDDGHHLLHDLSDVCAGCSAGLLDGLFDLGLGEFSQDRTEGLCTVGEHSDTHKSNQIE